MAIWKRLVALGIAGLVGCAAAADSGLGRCRAIADGAARLACYDALPLAGRPAPALEAPPLRVPAAPTAVPVAREERFGLENQVREAPLATIESRIAGRFEGWGPNSRIRLENGQAWQIADDSSRMFLQFDNPRVVIRRGALGSFFLDIEGDNRSPRVRRVQ